ncbi:MAG: ThuA domain-containing protein [Muribaculaceae bacterium]|nr:ThuA domain-containing protein [Muribaculaceae bacterium]
MYKTRILAILLACLLGGFAVKAEKGPEKVIVGYVTSWSEVMPDPSTLTHINYAFGLVKDTFDGVIVQNPDRLRAIAALKNTDPDLKVLLSVGGWGAGNFSEMVATDDNRRKFADDCLRIVKEFNLDGIDIDWEYPGSSVAGISSSPNDKDNFTLLLKQLRETLGDDRLVTIATDAGAAHVDYRGAVPYLDFVNMMTYDMGNAPIHHAALYPSENTSSATCDSSAKAHIAGGVPAGKLVMGVPFYGRGGKEMKGSKFRNIKESDGYKLIFDNVAKVPMMVNADGVPVMGYDDAHSLGLKCDYILENDLRGVMYWDYSGDDEQGTLRNTLASRLKGKTGKPHILVLSEGGGQHGPFTARAMTWLKGYADTHGMAITEIRNADPITEAFLADYDLIIQLDFPPYTWPAEAQKAFIDYIENGRGGWIGFHHATLLGEFDGYPLWHWFSNFMGDVTFKNYIAPLADGTVTVEDAAHPVMKGADTTFVLPDDEWYTYNTTPRPNVTVLASVDENSYTPASDVRMGDHPVVWTNPYKKARNVYFQPGHSPKLFESEAFRRMFANAIGWAMGDD